MIDCESLKIPEVKLIKPNVFADKRGYFLESFNQQQFNDAVGDNVTFLQDNQSQSFGGVLRGLHFQKNPFAQGKLVRVSSGEVFDVAVDMRKDSFYYGHWVSAILSDTNHHQLWIPEGFAHGFLVLSKSATFLYKTTNYYQPESEVTIRYDDSDLNISWPTNLSFNISVSEKDKKGINFADF